MKYIIIISILLNAMFFASGYAQTVPQGIAFQAVARDAGGAPIASASITIDFFILNGVVSEYHESHVVTTDPFGLFRVNIGNGTPITGSFASLNWETVNYSLQINITPSGGSTSVLGTQSLQSVPYAQHAETANAVTQMELNDLDDVNVSGATNGYFLKKTFLGWVPEPISQSQWQNNGTQISYSGGRVGIGDFTPDADFEIEGTGQNTVFLMTTFNPSSASDDTSTIFMTSGQYTHEGNGMGMRYVEGISGQGDQMQFYGRQAPNGDTGNHLVIERLSGRIGVGVSNPQKDLDINGAVRISSLAGSGNRKVMVEPDGDLIPAPVETRYMTLSPAAFNSWIGGQIIISPGSITSGSSFNLSLIADVQLPRNAFLTSITYYFTDNSATNRISFSLVRATNGSTSFVNIGSYSSSGINTTGVQAYTVNFTIPFPIDPNNYHYSLWATPYQDISSPTPIDWSDMAVNSVKFTYSIVP